MACCLRSHRLHRATWCWWLAALCLLKLAVPLIAVAAAHHRGVELVEVCSVYGMRTIALTPPGADSPADLVGLADGDLGSGPAQHTSDTAHDHCALGGMLGSAVVLLAVLGWLLPGRARPDPAPPAPRPTRRPDPLLRWLSARLHAPPLPA
ncbi:MAG TPA: DUF2946 family protein [Ideonella sp.]|uniref:DUF2946 family protein n=1 Tax=Ideonella sp. TaxID=1929293 RepID=UPI002C3AD516|nr:DUF2946 family protein [Ideonella sp.]HSI49749.1 DUF2946 family protein [Ideonella sp.]